MARRTFGRTPSTLADIEDLQNQLFEARRTILSLMPDAIQERVHTHYDITDRNDLSRWMRDLAKLALDLAEPRPESYLQGRANCPLCGYAGGSIYPDGYALPEGLRRHLTGHGNASTCAVMCEIRMYVLEHHRERFEREAASKKAASLMLVADRRAKETLYLVSPYDDPVLLDEITIYSPRPIEEMAWAEDRLIGLGFEIVIAGRVRSYIRRVPGATIYADPRRERNIDFLMLPDPLPKVKRRSPRPGQRFTLQDRWKHHIREHLDKMIATAAGLLKVAG